MGHEGLTIAEGYLNPTAIYGIIPDDIDGSLPPTCPYSIWISPTEPEVAPTGKYPIYSPRLKMGPPYTLAPHIKGA